MGCQFGVPGGTYPPKNYPSAPPGFFLYLLMFLEVKKIFPLNLVAGPCDSLNFDKILWHSIDICFILFFSLFFLQAKWGNSSSASIISRRTASIGESWFPYQRWKGYLGMLPIPWKSFREILLVMFYMKTKSWMLYFFRSSIYVTGQIWFQVKCF